MCLEQGKVWVSGIKVELPWAEVWSGEVDEEWVRVEGKGEEACSHLIWGGIGWKVASEKMLSPHCLYWNLSGHLNLYKNVIKPFYQIDQLQLCRSVYSLGSYIYQVLQMSW